MLFGGVTNFATTGFSLWKKTEERITEHSNSLKHRNCMIKLKNHSKVNCRIDQQLVNQINNERLYWINVLKRVVAVVKSLASRGLPFRGHDSKIGSPHNGNFLMALELIAEFDSFLATHLSKHGNPGKGKTSYISYQTYEQFICIMAEEVQKTIIQEIQIARYYSISVDSTPDISHTDQLSFIVRYVNEDGQPIERFLCFIEDVGHKSEQIATAVFSIFDKYDLNLKHLRGQSYDNASNMAGIYSGLQARIKMSSPHAQFVPCSAHSLNLVGTNAASCCQNAIYFFDLLQKLYVFFSSSTHRWKILNSNVKSLSETRWSARDDACKALNKNRELIINALEKIEQDVTERPATRCEAKGIIKKINTLEMSFLSLFWGDILCRFNNCSKKLQSVEINLGTVIDIYQSLITYVNDLRTDEEYIHYLNIAISISSENVMNTVNKRIKKRKTFSDENVDYDASNNDINFKISTYFVILDRLKNELEKRKIAYDQLFEKYSFFFQFEKLSNIEIREQAKRLQDIFVDDLGSSFPNECVHFKSHMKNLEIDEKPKNIQQMLVFIKNNDFSEMYPYVVIALRMFLCTPCSNCSTERSFSALKRVKSYLRSNIKEEKLNALAILNIENDITKKLNYNNVINIFAAKQARKKC